MDSTGPEIANSKAAQLLFGAARQQLHYILGSIAEYNQIAAALTEMGYTLRDEEWRVPRLELMGNSCTIIEDLTALDGFLEAGPQRGKKRLRKKHGPAIVRTA